MRTCIALLLPVLVAASPAAFASPTIETASTCLTDSTTGRDRKDLVKWVYLAMSKHPDIEGLSAWTPSGEEESARRVGALFTRLIADDCPDEMNAMVSEHGASSVSVAFEVVGRVAMQELMAHPNVQGVIAELERHADQARIAPVLETK